jgi:hypothetical protein
VSADDEPIPDPRVYHVSTIFGLRTQKPIVRVEAPALDMQMAPDDARRLGMNLIRAAEAAVSDALMMRFLREKIDAPPDAAVAVLAEWRQMRWDLEGDEV